MLKRLFVLALTLSACGDSEIDENQTSQAIAGSGSGSQERGDACDETPIDSMGTLPACVAGRSTSSGPGRHKDGNVRPEPAEAAETKAATAAANALSAARGNAGSNLADRGFAPVPAPRATGSAQ